MGAEQIRPQKQAPVAPPPPQPPPRGGRGGAQQTGNPAAPMMPRAAKLRGAGSWTKQARPSPRVTLGPAEPAVGASGELRDRLGVLLPAAGEPGAGGDKPKKQRRHGRAASTLTFARGTRPDKLKLCSNWQDCRAHGCVFAHSQVGGPPLSFLQGCLAKGGNMVGEFAGLCRAAGRLSLVGADQEAGLLRVCMGLKQGVGLRMTLCSAAGLALVVRSALSCLWATWR